MSRPDTIREGLRTGWRHRRKGLRARFEATGHRSPAEHGGDARPASPARRLRRVVFERLLRELDAPGDKRLRGPDLHARLRRVVDAQLALPDAPALSDRERAQLESDVAAEVGGLGPLEMLFADPTVSDILVNSADEVWIDRFGRLERTTVRFDDDEHLARLLTRWVAAQGRRLDESSPAVDVRLGDGSRLHAAIPPLCPHPTVSIRRPRPAPFRLEELYESGTLSPAMGALLAAAVAAGLNIAVSGGAASGKTTLLNVLSSFIPPNERVITIEEAAELRLAHPHVVSLEARLPNVEGRGEVTVRSLVRHALRMRADRIIVGEVRGGEVLDMLQAMNTGHEGSMTTVHANSPEDALRRLENLVLLGGFELPSAAIRELLAAAFDLLVQTTRLADGRRRITSIHDVARADGSIVTRELFRHRNDCGGHGEGHEATGFRPPFFDRLVQAGLDPAMLDGLESVSDSA